MLPVITRRPRGSICVSAKPGHPGTYILDFPGCSAGEEIEVIAAGAGSGYNPGVESDQIISVHAVRQLACPRSDSTPVWGGPFCCATGESPMNQSEVEQVLLSIRYPVYFLGDNLNADLSLVNVNEVLLNRMDRKTPTGEMIECTCLSLFSTDTSALLFKEIARSRTKLPVPVQSAEQLVILLKMVQKAGAYFVSADPLEAAVGQVKCLEISEVLRILNPTK